jgi:hypothetical protein
MSTTDAPAAYPGDDFSEKVERKLSLADQILAADDIERRLEDVPEWGVTIELRSPDGEERAALIDALVKITDVATGTIEMKDLRVAAPSVIAATAYDPETGERIFSFEPGTIAALSHKNGAVLDRLATIGMELCGLNPDAVEEAKKGSSTVPTTVPNTN